MSSSRSLNMCTDEGPAAKKARVVAESGSDSGSGSGSDEGEDSEDDSDSDEEEPPKGKPVASGSSKTAPRK